MTRKHKPVMVASGDEWARYRYRGYLLFDTSCGQAGVYDDHAYLGRTLDEAMDKIDARSAPDRSITGET